MRYFTEKEFECKCGCGFNPTTIDLMETLDRARAVAGVPFIISSGSRCPKHNREVGGSSTSSHLKGVAVDISCKNSHHRHLLIKALLDVGFSRLGIDNKFIHADIDREKPPEVVWTY